MILIVGWCVVIILLAIAAEAATEILVASDITTPFRKWLKKQIYPADRPPPDTAAQHILVFFDKLISCGYCTSVWAAGFLAFVAPTIVEYSLMNWLVSVLVIHRLANFWHVIYKLVLTGRIDTRDYKIEVVHEFRESRQGVGEGIKEIESEDHGAGGSQNSI